MLDRKPTINKIIHDNYKISQIKDIDNNKIKRLENIKEENDHEYNSFNRLLSLQSLIQKHSGLKELCKYSIIYKFNIILLLEKL